MWEGTGSGGDTVCGVSSGRSPLLRVHACKGVQGRACVCALAGVVLHPGRGQANHACKSACACAAAHECKQQLPTHMLPPPTHARTHSQHVWPAKQGLGHPEQRPLLHAAHALGGH